MRSPPGFPLEDGYCLLLIKSLYGLRRAPKIWRETLYAVLKEFGLCESTVDGSILLGVDLIVYVYVDDLFVLESVSAKRTREEDAWYGR
jgi:hypothetical protein